MKRDDDYLRELLVEFEAQDDWLVLVSNTVSASPDDRKRLGHVLLLCDVGWLAQVGSTTYRLTSQGHDYLAAIRSDTIWEKTKDGAAKVGGVSLGVMKDIAVAYVKQEISERLGLSI